jgi:hypothetical protein
MRSSSVRLQRIRKHLPTNPYLRRAQNSTFSAAVGITAAAFTPTGNTANPRAFHTAALLTNGKVLVAGGYVYDAYCLAGIASAELYSPG